MRQPNSLALPGQAKRTKAKKKNNGKKKKKVTDDGPKRTVGSGHQKAGRAGPASVTKEKQQLLGPWLLEISVWAAGGSKQQCATRSEPWRQC